MVYQISNFLNKKKTKKIYANGSAREHATRKWSETEDPNLPLWSVIRPARDCNFPLTREIINTKAKEFAEKLSNEPWFLNRFTNVNHPYFWRFWWVPSFHASDGSRNLRDAMVLLMAGESADADIENAGDFIVNVLPGLIEGYAAEDIYNADETGVFYKCLPDKT
jgi:hypothetical protein